MSCHFCGKLSDRYRQITIGYRIRQVVETCDDCGDVA
jgi:hypothetical protein